MLRREIPEACRREKHDCFSTPVVLMLTCDMGPLHKHSSVKRRLVVMIGCCCDTGDLFGELWEIGDLSGDLWDIGDLSLQTIPISSLLLKSGDRLSVKLG